MVESKTANRELLINVGKGQGDWKKFVNTTSCSGDRDFVRGRSSAGVFLGTRYATKVVKRRKIASSRPVVWSCCPISVNNITNVLYLHKL